MNRHFLKQHLFESDFFWNCDKVFVTFDQSNATLENRSIHFLTKKQNKTKNRPQTFQWRCLLIASLKMSLKCLQS